MTFQPSGESLVHKRIAKKRDAQHFAAVLVGDFVSIYSVTPKLDLTACAVLMHTQPRDCCSSEQHMECH